MYFLFYSGVVAVGGAGDVTVAVIVMHLNRMDSSTDNQLNYDQYERCEQGKLGRRTIRWDSLVSIHIKLELQIWIGF